MRLYLLYLTLVTVLFLAAMIGTRPLSTYIKHHREATMKQGEPTPEERKALIENMKMECINEKDIHPEDDPEGAALFKQARNIQKKVTEGTDEQVVALYQKAVKRGYWRAYSELAECYLYGRGVQHDSAKAIALLEEGMKRDIGRCYALMGNMLAYGHGVKKDTSAAYVYQRKAAELGFSPSMVVVGEQMRYVEGALEVGISILECAEKQGNPMAAYEMGARLSFPGDPDFNQTRALHYLQRATYLGNADAALKLWSSFNKGKMELEQDLERAKRYQTLKHYIEPLNQKGDYPQILNLDAIVPLPPAELPEWDGTYGGDAGSALRLLYDVRPRLHLPGHGRRGRQRPDAVRDHLLRPAAHDQRKTRNAGAQKPVRRYLLGLAVVTALLPKP